jgi:glycosyltransferase involved in cell wall biosynthesis
VPLDSIGVVTLTRDRPELVRRAMASVYAQDYRGRTEHLVVVDNDPASVPVVEAAPRRPGLRVAVHLAPRPPGSDYGSARDRRVVYPRIASLFNLGVRLSSADWVAFLDDDNEYEPNHLSSLFMCAQEHGVPAVHSGRTMYWPDGSPFVEPVWHTTPDPGEGSRIYQLMCRRGVRFPGTNVLLDRADPVASRTLRPSTVVQDDDPVLLVDQSVWLIRREVMLELPIPETFTDEDYAMNAAPDDKLLEVLITHDVPVVSSRLPTVRYYLGGVSNDHSVRPDAGRGW